MTDRDYILHFDGQNDFPKQAGGWGYHLNDDIGTEVAIGYGYIAPGPLSTCNTAEWEGLIQGIVRMVGMQLNVGNLTIIGDSQLIINQAALKYRCKMPHLAMCFARYMFFLQEIKANQINYVWVPREENCRADELSNIGRRSKRGFNANHPKNRFRKRTTPAR